MDRYNALLEETEIIEKEALSLKKEVEGLKKKFHLQNDKVVLAYKKLNDFI